MRRFAIIMIAALLILTTGASAFAKSSAASTTEKGATEADASFVIGTGPDGFDAGVGFCVGAGTIIAPNLQIRGDLTVVKFSKDVPWWWGTLDYTRIPLTFSARYYIPSSEDVKVFVQGGFEISFDHMDVVTPSGWETTDNEVNFGITPGAGVQIGIAPQLDFVADVRYHIIDHDYATFQAGIAFKF